MLLGGFSVQRTNSAVNLSALSALINSHIDRRYIVMISNLNYLVSRKIQDIFQKIHLK